MGASPPDPLWKDVGQHAPFPGEENFGENQRACRPGMGPVPTVGPPVRRDRLWSQTPL